MKSGEPGKTRKSLFKIGKPMMKKSKKNRKQGQ